MSTEKEHCTHLACICDKCQYDEANWLEKIQLQLHLLRCPKCKEYADKNKRLSQLLSQAKLKCLNIEEQKELKQLLQKNLPGQKRQ